MDSARTALKNRFREVVIARKTKDVEAVRARGVDLLATIKDKAATDLQALEAAFLDGRDFEPLLRRIERDERAKRDDGDKQ